MSVFLGSTDRSIFVLVNYLKGNANIRHFIIDCCDLMVITVLQVKFTRMLDRIWCLNSIFVSFFANTRVDGRDEDIALT